MKKEYTIEFYERSNGYSQVKMYIQKVPIKREKSKIIALIEHLRECEGYLEEPHSKHIDGKLRELRVKRHRIIYAVIGNKIILLLYGFFKETDKTPDTIIKRSQRYYDNYIKSE